MAFQHLLKVFHILTPSSPPWAKIHPNGITSKGEEKISQKVKSSVSFLETAVIYHFSHGVDLGCSGEERTHRTWLFLYTGHWWNSLPGRTPHPRNRLSCWLRRAGQTVRRGGKLSWTLSSWKAFDVAERGEGFRAVGRAAARAQASPGSELLDPLPVSPGPLLTPSFHKKALRVFLTYHLPSWVALCTEHSPPGTEGHPQHLQAFQGPSGCNGEQSGSIHCVARGRPWAHRLKDWIDDRLLSEVEGETNLQNLLLTPVKSVPCSPTFSAGRRW